MKKIFEKIDAGELLTKEEAIQLLNISPSSEDFYKLLSKANELSRKE